jgi:nucleotide-binding universal stress UspA family protein
MDDKDREILGGGAVGGALGFAVGGPAGAAAGAAVGGWLFGQENDHDATLRAAFHAANDATGPEARLYVDHVDPDAAQPLSPGDLLEDVDGEPDMVVITADGASLVVEVETPEAFDSEPEALLGRLADARADGFQRVVVVPEAALEDAAEWLQERTDDGDLDGSLTVTTPAGITDEL